MTGWSTAQVYPIRRWARVTVWKGWSGRRVAAEINEQIEALELELGEGCDVHLVVTAEPDPFEDFYRDLGGEG